MGISMPQIEASSKTTPLAAILRPKTLTEIIGQDHLTGEGKPLRKMAEKGIVRSTILWGPAGTGKTSIVRALASDTKSSFHQLNATDATVKDIRAIIAEAGKKQTATFVFVDEIHRWTKSQQDVMLPVVEDGIITLFGATTEKPSFAVNSTILSRCLVLEVKSLDDVAMVALLKKVKKYYREKNRPFQIDADAAKLLINRCGGDARKMILSLETAIEILSDDYQVTVETINHAIPSKHIMFDANGNDHFDIAHCYQESIQNSDVNSALYWLGKWIKSGEDPAYICRRMLITAFEDCAGNPSAWLAAMVASYTTERTGLPECMIPMSLATVEMTKSKRNKSAYLAIKEVMSDLENQRILDVPPGLRAGTRGYISAVSKNYLPNWVKDNQVKSQGEIQAPLLSDPQTVYAIGIATKGINDVESLGMINGPTPQLEKMLEAIGEENAYIVEFGPDGHRLLYEWTGGGWVGFKDAHR